MTVCQRIRIFVIIVFLIGLSSSIARADDLLLLNHPVNTQGLSGLLFTTAPYTLPSGTMEIGMSALATNSHQPEYRILEYPASVSFGLPHNTELALKSSYGDIKDSSSAVVDTVHETGDAVFSVKWNFIPQQDDSTAPAVAFFASGMIPAANKSDTRINSITRWGVRLGIAAGSEFAWRDHILDIYADASIIDRDPSDTNHDVYWNLNSGLLFPISKYKNLQTLLEYSIVGGKDRISYMYGGNYSAMTYGLRLVSERFNLTIGTQLIHNQVEGYGKSEKTLGLMSIKF